MRKLTIRNVKRGLPLVLVPLARFDVPEALQNALAGYRIARERVFDSRYYRHRYPDVDESGLHPIVHYILYGASEGRDPNRNFDTRAYAERYLGGITSGVNPLYHYVKHNGHAKLGPGDARRKAEDSVTVKAMLQSKVLIPCPLHPNAHKNERIGTQGKRKILFLGHEASRTGAPMILLRIMQYFAEFDDIECILVLERGGELVADYAQVAHVIRADRDINFKANNARNWRKVLRLIADPAPAFVLANSACTMDFLAAPHEQGFKVMLLVHEYLSFWERDLVQGIYKNADTIVFPSLAVRDVADQHVPLGTTRTHIIPQGLLHEKFLQLPKEELRQKVIDELGLPENSFIVLGSGTLDLRKGVDRFLTIAFAAFRRLSPTDRSRLHFVWLGGHHHMTPVLFEKFCEDDIRNAKLERNIHFVGVRRNPESFFAAANLLLISSRADPFPCVVHEAMAMSTPVMTFEGSGGAPEAVADGGGYRLPYDDFDQAADIVVGLMKDPAAAIAEGERAKAVVQEKFSFRDYVRKLTELAFRELNPDLPQLEHTVHVVKHKRDPKVFIASPDFTISGVNTFSFALTEQLLKLGLDTELLYTREHRSHGDALHQPNLPGRHVAPFHVWGEDLWERVQSFLRHEAPCILIPNYDYWVSAICPALPDSIGVMGIVHSDDIEHYEHAYRLGRYWNSIVCVSSHIQAEVESMNPSFSDRTVCIPYGISEVPEQFTPRNRSAEDPLRIIYTGRLVQHQKRIRDLVHIVRALDGLGARYRMTIVGSGETPEDEGFLRSRLSEHLRDGRVLMPGRLPYEQVLALLKENDAFILTSAWEGLPLSLLEAMAQGCAPVVSQIASGVPDILRQGENGYTVPIGDADGFAYRLNVLQKNPGDQDRVAAAAHRTICEGYTSAHMANKYAQEIERIHKQLIEGTYRRPKPLHYLPHIGYVAPPPQMQIAGHHLRDGRTFWDLKAISRD